MTGEGNETLFAVDVGNSRAKWGRFVEGQLVDTGSFALDTARRYDKLQSWRLESTGTSWSVASVNPAGSEPLLAWAREKGHPEPLVLEDPAAMPLRVDLERPEAVGIDRLLAAVAVNQRRPAGHPAVIVDCGSAITVDALSADGAFLGGAIAPGIGLSARGLHQFTYWLPLLNVSVAPPPVGKSTPDAMRSGLYWGTLGALKELLRRITDTLDPPPTVYVSGGDAPLLSPHLGCPHELVPELTLEGIYLATQHVQQHS